MTVFIYETSIMMVVLFKRLYNVMSLASSIDANVTSPGCYILLIQLVITTSLVVYSRYVSFRRDILQRYKTFILRCEGIYFISSQEVCIEHINTYFIYHTSTNDHMHMVISVTVGPRDRFIERFQKRDLQGISGVSIFKD
jgi:hypothetical protein